MTRVQALMPSMDWASVFSGTKRACPDLECRHWCLQWTEHQPSYKFSVTTRYCEFDFLYLWFRPTMHWGEMAFTLTTAAWLVQLACAKLLYSDVSEAWYTGCVVHMIWSLADWTSFQMSSFNQRLEMISWVNMSTVIQNCISGLEQLNQEHIISSESVMPSKTKPQ